MTDSKSVPIPSLDGMNESRRQSVAPGSGGSGLVRLSVAIVCFHSDLDMLANTIDSLQHSLAASVGIQASLTVVDNSCDEAYGKALQDLHILLCAVYPWGRIFQA